MKKILLIASLAVVIVAGMSALPSVSQAQSLGSKLSGRILLAVQANGEAWYVDPSNDLRYFLGQPVDAFNLMQQLGLGISNKDFNSFNGKAPVRLSGRILLKVEDSGKAYYVNPLDLKLYYLGNPTDAFKVMRKLGLGITNSNLSTIPAYAGGLIPSIEVDYQSTKYANVTVREVVARTNGWIVIHKVVNDQAGDIVGYSAIKKGENHNVSVRLVGINTSQDLIAMLHYDLGQIGSFEYPGPDVPVMLNNEMVMKKFFTTFAARESESVQIIDSSFNPKTLTVGRGDLVTWTNYDGVTQTITSTGNFDSSNIISGKTFSRIFNDAGTFHYFSSLHPNMTGTIIVE
jgi:plastocyanin